MDIFQVFSNNGIILSEKEAIFLENYAILLKDYNQRVNLISRKEIDDVLIRHILPCYIFSSEIGSYSRVLDIGTGGGLPGIPFSVKHEKSQILLVDSTKKKIDAVSEIVQTIGLINVDTYWTRVEDNNFINIFGERFDLIISRATVDIQTIINYSIPLFNNLNKGKVALMKGGNLTEEIKMTKKKFRNVKISVKPLTYTPGNENNLNQKFIVTVENFR